MGWKKRNIKFEDENLSLSIEEIRAYNTIAVRFHQFDENKIIWNTDTISFIPKFKPPILVNMLLERGYIGTDKDMPISDKPIFINKDNYKVIENIICRNVVYSMPVIYVTKLWGNYPLRVQDLA